MGESRYVCIINSTELLSILCNCKVVYQILLETLKMI